MDYMDEKEIRIYQNSDHFKINNQHSGSWLEKEINEIKKLKNLAQWTMQFTLMK